MTLTMTQLLHAHRQLAALQQRAAWAYGLAYDRPGQRIRAGGGKGHSDDLPVRVSYRNRVEHITASSDPAWETAYLKAAKQLAEADRLVADAVTQAGGCHHQLRTRHIVDGVTPSPAFLARLCANTATGLRTAVTAWALAGGGGVGLAHTTATRQLLEDATRRINQAHRLIPDNRHPEQPVECRNPRGRDQCDQLPIYDHKRRLCQSCYNAENYRSKDKPRKRTKRRK